MRGQILFTHGSGDACFHCGQPNPRQIIDWQIKFWACSDECVRAYRTELFQGAKNV